MKKSRFAKIVLALVLALVLGALIALPAFAEGPTYGGGTPADPAKAPLTKRLQMPEGTVTPAATFNFTFEKVTLNNAPTPTPEQLATMPAISMKSISFTSADAGTVAAGVKTINKEFAVGTPAVNDVLNGVTFPNAGVYTYLVKEQQGGPYVPAANETMTYSPAEYQLVVYVANDPTSGPYVSAVSLIIIKDENGDPGDGEKVGGGGGGDGQWGALFINSYTRTTTTGPDIDDPDYYALAISKKVTGTFGDQTLPFIFDVTMAPPAVASPLTTYVAHIVAADGTRGPALNFVVGQPSMTQAISLKHDETLMFVELPVGASYTAVERAVPDYTASAQIIVNGAAPVALSNAGPNAPLSSETRIIGADNNEARFSNDYKDVPITGLDISNLPFFVMLGVAVGLLAVMLITKSRRQEEVLY